ncbi:MAG TPA: (2Fe-2S)-binding protein [Chloroflexi bacterium]|jgi:carbon-monoxide dehydrogenase small subunit|nr:(2Fe-2S)-binding protein [Chloroflexota bacterium]
MSAIQLVSLSVNGEDHELAIDPRRTLVDVLRHDLGLTGTHVGCEHGVCGACTVLLDGEPVRACLIFAPQVEGRDVRTIESLSTAEPSDLQEAFMARHSLQCGFCTPGFLMLAEGYLATEPTPDREDVREIVSSNMCRCTGYQTIVDAVHSCATARANRSSELIRTRPRVQTPNPAGDPT